MWGLYGCECIIIFSAVRMFFLGDLGEWSKPRVCKTLYHKFESCHRLSFDYAVMFLRHPGICCEVMWGLKGVCVHLIFRVARMFFRRCG